jgi:hypothetical protein
MKPRLSVGLLAPLAFWAALWHAAPAASAEVLFPLGSRLGLTPPPGIERSQVFPGFEDRTNNVFIRLITMPGPAFAEIEKTMTNDALKKQGMTVEKRDRFAMPQGSSGILVVAQQEAGGVRFRKWLLVAPIADVTAMVSFEIPNNVKDSYPEAVIRAALATTAARAEVPIAEQLDLLPFRLGDFADMRVARVLPGVGLQLTDGPNDDIETTGQPHLIVSIARGGPPYPRDRDNFARLVLAGLPPLNDVRITGSKSMRLGRMQGHEMRASGKDVKTGGEVQIVQWLRFGQGAYLRLLGFAPKDDWTKSFMRFRAVRDGVEAR